MQGVLERGGVAKDGLKDAAPSGSSVLKGSQHLPGCVAGLKLDQDDANSFRFA
jgi:hypothetical protein